MNSEKRASSYVADANDLNEMARLINQDRASSALMFSIYNTLPWATFHQVLDIGCGPGGWILDMAHRYPDIEFIGVDNNEQMLTYAQLLAQADGLQNVRFLLMDVTEQFAFPHASFDFVHGRFMYAFLVPSAWPNLLQECSRVLRPDGTLTIIEHETHFSTSAAIERLAENLTRAGFLAGRSFSPTGRGSGISPVLKGLLHDAGFSQVIHQALLMDNSFGEPGYEIWKENVYLMTLTFRRFITTSGGATPEETEEFLNQALKDMENPSFRMVSLLCFATGQKV